jgi:hypothetical protein
MQGLPPGVRGSAGPEGRGPEPEGIPLPPELRYAKDRLPRHSFPVSTDVRYKLEGGIETLEAALARYAILEKALRSLAWQRKTLRRLDTLRELVRNEPAVEEALTRLHRRARAEDWLDTEPALGLARKVEQLRSSLEALTRKHLDMPADRESRLVDNLARIEQRLIRTVAPPLSSEERVLEQGACLPWKTPPPFLVLIGMLIVIDFFDSVLPESEWNALITGVVLMMFIVGFLPSSRPRVLIDRRPGGFWLTEKRLVWRPRWGATIHIPFHAIRPGGVERLSSQSVRVHLVDGRYVFLKPLVERDAERLVAFLNSQCPASRPGESHERIH